MATTQVTPGSTFSQGSTPPVSEEQEWLHWLTKARERAITPAQAAGKMGVTERWVRELLLETPGSGATRPGFHDHGRHYDAKGISDFSFRPFSARP